MKRDSLLSSAVVSAVCVARLHIATVLCFVSVFICFPTFGRQFNASLNVRVRVVRLPMLNVLSSIMLSHERLWKQVSSHERRTMSNMAKKQFIDAFNGCMLP